MTEAAHGPMFPDITVQLTGENGNIFNLMACVTRAMRDHHLPDEFITRMVSEVMDSGSYEEALRVLGTYVTTA